VDEDGPVAGTGIVALVPFVDGGLDAILEILPSVAR
jgi:hypothetical protein